MAKKSSKKAAKKASKKPAKKVVKLAPKTAKLLFSYTPAKSSVRTSAVTTADRRPPAPPVPIPTSDYHTYVVIDAPSTCANYPVGTQFSYQSADTYITVNMGPGCDPVYAMLDE